MMELQLSIDGVLDHIFFLFEDQFVESHDG